MVDVCSCLCACLCIGQRPFLGTRKGDKYEWVSYKDASERITNLGSGMIQMGLAPGQKTFVGIYSGNRVDWVIAEQVCNHYSMVSVPLYDTLGDEAIEFILNQGE
jgi:long-chain acyl-CoA synthetase